MSEREFGTGLWENFLQILQITSFLTYLEIQNIAGLGRGWGYNVQALPVALAKIRNPVQASTLNTVWNLLSALTFKEFM